ncbi:wall-associated receptor kinase-like 9 [Humulus lupulus]|uniref:wall-associated receptor kinase-like 9 n=2 Tax=Humulus lupulus TaxID=3486 RepID=UPI002B41369E|nr:wall-associated receptor kinase-like 9 [Humulus lupulus]
MSTLASLARPGCQEKCGNVDIPYPFGIGPSECFLDERFEISCDNSYSTPVLKHTQLHVLNISLSPNSRDDYPEYDYSQWIVVRNPISFFDCGNKTRQKSANLTGTPFYYSSDNVFIAVSGGVLATFKTRSGNMHFKNGCSSNSTTTTSTSHNFSNCDGVECCATRVISYYSDVGDMFEISMDNGSSGTPANHSQCKYAFLIDYDEIDKHKTFGDLDYVPVRLSWFLNSTYFDVFKTHDMPTETINFDCRTSTEDYDNLLESSSDRIHHCWCKYGLRGNPYLVGGCNQDMNECIDGIAFCYGGSTCVNTFGDSHCSYKRRAIFIETGVGSPLGLLVLLFSTWRLYIFIKKRKEIKRKKAFFKRNGGLLLEQQIHSSENNVEQTKLFKSKELEKATNNFNIDRVLGQGGQGTVYKGMLEDGKIVAVKKSKIIDEAKLSEFINEVVILTQINHRNVVRLLGCCLETDVPLLVYEFIPNGTLSEYIHDKNAEFPFTWNMRLRIATEVAGALSYLHSAASFPIYHRDVKSTNILLDEKLRAKVADFGTSRTISLEQTHLTTLVYGTFGYLDPEYFQSSQFTDKSDVYSFGVVLVELLTGQKAISATRSEEEGRSLATYFMMTMEEKSSSLFDILDGQVLKDAPKEEILIVVDLAKRCLHLNGRNRPTMKEVAKELERIQGIDNKDSNGIQHNYEDLAYAQPEIADYSWNVSTSSTGLAFDSAATSFSLHQELPLL